MTAPPAHSSELTAVAAQTDSALAELRREMHSLSGELIDLRAEVRRLHRRVAIQDLKEKLR